MKLKHTLAAVTLYFLKLLLIIKKILGTTINYSILKPLQITAKFLLYKLFLKGYGQYLLAAKRIRLELALDKLAPKIKYQPIFLIFIITIGVLIYNIAHHTATWAISDNIYTAPITKLFANEFEGYQPEALITESPTPKKPLATKYFNTPNQTLITTKTTAIIVEPIINALNNYGAMIVLGNTNDSGGKLINTRTTIIEYEVSAGETVSAIANKFGLGVNTVLWANNLTARSIIKQGMKLKIMPTDGIMHTVVRNETLGSIAKKYGVSTDKILEANELSGNTLKIGQELMVPGGKKIAVVTTITTKTTTGKVTTVTKTNAAPVIRSDTSLQWPTSGYRLTQYYSWRHTGVDIANKVGTPLYAAEDGVVEQSGWNGSGYGNMILIRHANGMKTRYGHASALYVKAGETVVRGQVIAAMGSTGRSTGSHLHFEVYVGGKRVNPLNYIR